MYLAARSLSTTDRLSVNTAHCHLCHNATSFDDTLHSHTPRHSIMDLVDITSTTSTHCSPSAADLWDHRPDLAFQTCNHFQSHIVEKLDNSPNLQPSDRAVLLRQERCQEDQLLSCTATTAKADISSRSGIRSCNKASTRLFWRTLHIHIV